MALKVAKTMWPRNGGIEGMEIDSYMLNNNWPISRLRVSLNRIWKQSLIQQVQMQNVEILKEQINFILLK